MAAAVEKVEPKIEQEPKKKSKELEYLGKLWIDLQKAQQIQKQEQKHK